MKSTLTNEKTCLVCGSENVEWHHVFFGTANRKIADKYGYVVPLCAEHHRGKTGIHQNREMDLLFKATAEWHFLDNHGTVKDFIKIFGKNYLLQEDCE